MATSKRNVHGEFAVLIDQLAVLMGTVDRFWDENRAELGYEFTAYPFAGDITDQVAEVQRWAREVWTIAMAKGVDRPEPKA